MPQVWLIGELNDLRALLGYGVDARRNQEGNPAPEAVESSRQLEKLKARVHAVRGDPEQVWKSQRPLHTAKCQAEPNAQSHDQANSRCEIVKPGGELSTGRMSMSTRTKESVRISTLL